MKKLITFVICLAFATNVFSADNWEHTQIPTEHTNWLFPEAFSPDGKQLAIVSSDGTIRIWNIQSGEIVKELTEHTEYEITAVAFSSDGKQLATASSSDGTGTIRIWNIQSGEMVKELTEHIDMITAVAFSPDSCVLSGASSDETIHRWVNTTAPFYGAVRIWNIQNGEMAKELTEHTDLITAEAFSPDGKQLATAPFYGPIRIWNIPNGEMAKELTKHASYGTTAVAFSSDGTQLAATADDGAVRIWNIPNGEMVKELTEHTDLIRAVAFSHDGTQLTAASSDGTMHRWVNTTAVARRNAQRLAFAQVMHPRLAANSPANVLSQELAAYICDKSSEAESAPAAPRAWHNPCYIQ